jgi:AraC-like DNA-binding protein
MIAYGIFMTWLPHPVSWTCGLTARGGSFSGHVHHACDEICLVANMGTTIRHGGVEREASPGTVFLFRHGECHGYRNATDQEPHLWLVHYERDPALERACPRLADPDPERRVWHLDAVRLAGFQTLFARMIVESMQSQQAGHLAAVSGWLRLLLIAASRWDEPFPTEPPGLATDSELANLWEVLHEHLEAPDADVTAALARRVPKYDSLRHRFKRAYGRAPREFLAHLRIERAKHLLLETDLQVGAIASQLGYGRLAEFTRAFTRHVGVSPRTFRSAPG